MSAAVIAILAESSLRVTFAAGAVAVILFALRIHDSSARHAAWTAVLLAMLVMPILPYCVTAIVAIPVHVPHRVSAIPVDSQGAGRVILEGAGRAAERPVHPARRPSSSDGVPGAVFHAHTFPRPSWPTVVLVTYGAVMLALIARLAAGWYAAARMVRMGKRIVLPEWSSKASVYESNSAVIPITAGVFSPAIVLPVTWRELSEETLRAALYHELAHVQRRDPLVRFLAHLVCCVFWFHPLAWWLRREVDVTAEYACDDRAARRLGEPACYADVLLEMARAMSIAGGRVLPHCTGFGGGDSLRERIERILRSEFSRQLSPARKGAVAVSSVLAIFLVAACRLRAPSPAPAYGPTGFAQERVPRLAGSVAETGAPVLLQEQEELEAAVRRDPEDFTALRRLLVSYWSRLNSDGPVEATVVAKRRSHILWLVEHHPDSGILDSVEARLFPDGFGSLADPGGYAEAKRLWAWHTSRADPPARVLGNAASFFETAEKPTAEALLVRARAADPDGPWPHRLGSLYAAALVGSYVLRPGGGLVRVVDTALQSSYADSVRKALAECDDERVLVSAARYAIRAPRAAGANSDPDSLAQPWLERVLLLDPGSVEARMELVGIRARRRLERVHELVANVPPVSQYDAVAALAKEERFELLAGLAYRAYMNAELSGGWPDLQKFTASDRDLAERYAEELLKLAPGFRRDPSHGAAVYKANMTLASLAWRSGDPERALLHLHEAASAPASEELVYSRGITAWSVLGDLVRAGNRDTVAGFLERLAETNVARRSYLREAAAAIREGKSVRFDNLPDGYLQYLQ